MSDARTLALAADSILTARRTRGLDRIRHHVDELLAPEWTVTGVAHDGAAIAAIA